MNLEKFHKGSTFNASGLRTYELQNLSDLKFHLSVTWAHFGSDLNLYEIVAVPSITKVVKWRLKQA